MMRKSLLALLLCLFSAGSALAVPEATNVRITDVTPSSFSVVWMTDVAATPEVEVYDNSSMTGRITGSITVTPMPDAPADVAAAARGKGIMKVRVAGLAPNTGYHVRTVTADPADPASVGYSVLQEVTTATSVMPYRQAGDGTLRGMANDLVPLRVYIRPNDKDAVPGLGDLLLLETSVSPYPLSAFIGVGAVAPEGVVDLNNLFGADLTSLGILGGEKTVLSIYRGGNLPTLFHYRSLPAKSGIVSAVEPLKGFFADINLDGKVDGQDFDEFRKQYRTTPDDAGYNPDFNFVEDTGGRIDAGDFVRFAAEYGRVDVP